MAVSICVNLFNVASLAALDNPHKSFYLSVFYDISTYTESWDMCCRVVSMLHNSMTYLISGLNSGKRWTLNISRNTQSWQLWYQHISISSARVEFGYTVYTASTHPGPLPLHSLVLQTSQIFHRPSVITMQLYCMLLSSGQTRFMIRSDTLLLLKWY